MQIFSICPKSFASNNYLLCSNGSALLVDPSLSVDTIAKKLDEQELVLKGVLLTHGHFDHIVSIDTVREQYDVPVYIHKQ